MIVGTYREMPGLSLHLHQAARFFGITANTCRAVLDDLVMTGELQKRKDGQVQNPLNPRDHNSLRDPLTRLAHSQN
jgi:hypothetical protein